MSPDSALRYKEELKDDREWKACLKEFERSENHVGLFGLVTIKAFSCKRSDTGWRFVWRAECNGKHIVAFIDTAHFVRGFAKCIGILARNDVTWYKDKYA